MASIQARGSRWFAQVAKNGVRKSKSFPSRGEAEAWADALEASLGQSTKLVDRSPGLPSIPTDGEMTLGDVLTRYRREVGPVKKWGRTKHLILERIARDLGHVRLSELTDSVLVDFARSRAEGGASPSTVHQDMSYISGALRVARAVWKYPVGANVVTDAQEAVKLLGLVGQSRKRHRVATDAELSAMKLAWRSQIPPSIIDFAVLSGMRLGEILRIRRSDRNGSKILVRERKHPTMKAENNQWVPLLNGAAELLDALPTSGDRYYPYPPETVIRAWERARERSKVDDLNFHDLRHTALTRLRKQGLGIPELAVVSGHRSWTMLQRYVNLTAEDVIAQIAAE